MKNMHVPDQECFVKHHQRRAGVIWRKRCDRLCGFQKNTGIDVHHNVAQDSRAASALA